MTGIELIILCGGVFLASFGVGVVNAAFGNPLGLNPPKV